MGSTERQKSDTPLVVPQNSLSNLRHRLLPKERQQSVCNTYSSQPAEQLTSCPHCENMAKNFLYLESLIRGSCNHDKPCHVCNSSLQYLQHVNKSIVEVFGSFDKVVEAAKTFTTAAMTATAAASPLATAKMGLKKQRSRVAKPKPAEIEAANAHVESGIVETGKRINVKVKKAKSPAKMTAGGDTAAFGPGAHNRRFGKRSSKGGDFAQKSSRKKSLLRLTGGTLERSGTTDKKSRKLRRVRSARKVPLRKYGMLQPAKPNMALAKPIWKYGR